ncbi:response regulator [Stenotrophomonas sp. Iso1]|uniref:response regulator n=1 Tax=Stenotrophomonas sp. Iso1 TaxID=2977283 RepID=UPI0022B7ADB7|nr:response regulator [Stenotrophomonas sp. Iso1]
MHRFLPRRPSIDARLVAASVLLRWLSACVLLCLLGTAGFYLAAQLGEATSLHRRDMNAAAYRAQLYFDEREALLKYLADAVIASPARHSSACSVSNMEGLRCVPLGTTPTGLPLQLLLSTKAESTLDALGAQLLHVSSDPNAPMRWLHTPHQHTASLLPALDPSLLQQHALSARNTSRVFWLAPPQENAAIYLYRSVGDSIGSDNWLVLVLDSNSVNRAIEARRVGSVTLLNPHDRQILSNPADTQLPINWLDAHRQDAFSVVWVLGLPRGLALVKGIGQDGWRLVYHLPMLQLLRDIGSHIAATLLLCLLAAAALWVVMRRIDRQLIQPAHQQHRQLLESFDFGATLIDMAPVGMCVLRCSDAKVVLENQLARDWLGCDTSKGDWNGLWRHVDSRSAVHTGNAIDFTTDCGRQLQVLFAATRYQDEVVSLCVFNDVSQHQQMRSALEAALSAADMASQAKSSFVATLSHEIRTPLYGMLGTLELLTRTPLDAKQAQYLQLIQQSSSVLQQLIRDTLDVSRIESGQLVLTAAAFSPLDLAESTLRSYADSAMRKQLQILVCTDPRLPSQVMGDADRIRQVLGNLLSNAIKFTDSGRIFLRVRLLKCQDGIASISWQVTDTGAGIATSEQARLFKPFGQLDSQARGEGSGLGLSISDHLVRLMKGELRLVSDLGLGSSFSVTLPLPLVDSGDAAPEDVTPRLQSHPPVYVRASIPELVESACRWLQRWGATALPYVVGTAPTTDDAILVDSDPRDSLTVGWPGPRVVALPEAGDVPSRDAAHPNQLTVTLFSIRAIAQAVADLQDKTHPTPSVPATSQAARALGLRVLVAEDNPINLLLLKEQLGILGCRVVTACDGREALAYCETGQFDAVLTDLNMPAMDGLTLTRKLRARGFTIPIIGASADTSDEDRARALREGMDDYLLKPISIEALRQALGNAQNGTSA